MTGIVLLGPFLTRREAARRAGLSTHDVSLRPDLLRLRGLWLEETYFGFQFARGRIDPDLARVVVALKKSSTDEAIADWLTRPHPTFSGATPLDRIHRGTAVAEILAAAADHGPARSAEAGPEGDAPAGQGEQAKQPAVRSLRRAVAPRPRLAG